jgi:hypothetical protein
MTLEARRRIRREWMRRWRRDPAHRRIENERRQDYNVRRREIYKRRRAEEARQRPPRCHWCQRKPVELVERNVLHPVRGHNREWEPVPALVPYCGEC